MSSSKSILFVTWDGPAVNYLETLFAPIFARLQATYGYRFYIAQFTSAEKEKCAARQAYLHNLGLPYLSLPLSGNLTQDLVKARLFHIRTLSRYIRENEITCLMPRAVTALFLTQSLIHRHNLKLIWDADGFPLDERVDFSGLSPFSLRYRIFRDQELKGYHRASALICRSEKARSIITARAGSGFDPAKVFVVHNGVLNPVHKPLPSPPTDRIRLVYTGSAGPQYLIPRLLDLVQALLPLLPQLHLTLITYQTNEVRYLLQLQYPTLGSIVNVCSLPPDQVPQALASAHVGVAFRQPTFSMLGVAPIKVSEYLNAGLSVLYTPGTGDLDELMGEQPFAYSLSLDAINLPALAEWLQQQASGKHREEVGQFAEKRFGLDTTAAIYHQALQH